MLTSALTAIKKFFDIRVDVREASKRPLEEESENEFEEIIISHATEPQRKKSCSCVDHSLTTSNNTLNRFSPVLMRFPWLAWKKEENPNPLLDVKMSDPRSQKPKEESDAEVTVVEERVRKWSVPASVPVSNSSKQEDDSEVSERREPRSVSDLATCRPPLSHTPIADFRFVPSSMRPLESDIPAKHKSRNSNCLRISNNHKSLSTKTKLDFKGHPGTVLDRLLGKRRSAGILSSRIKRSVVQKSFLHEEKMKYHQLLQQYTEHYLTPNSKIFSRKVSSFLSSPVGMVTRSQWTPLWTKQKQEQIENASSVSSSSRLLPSEDKLAEVLRSKKIIGLEESPGRYPKQRSSLIPVPLVDLSKEYDEQNTSDKESDGDSVIMIKEVLSPQSQRNSLEERLKEHPLYDLDWIKSMRKEYEDRAHNAKKDADTTSKLIQELEQKRSKKVSLDEKVTQRLKLLDLTYPSKYTEVQIPDEEEEEAFVPLTPEMENKIDDALNKTSLSEVLIEKFHIQISRRDIRTLDGLNWLNDEVINFYMNLIMDRSQNNDNYPSVYAFNTFFYPKLSKNGYQSVRRWTKKVDLFSHDMLLVPIHLGMHWCMTVVDFKMRNISYYDSMLGSNEWCLQSLLEYLEAEHQDKKGSSYNTAIWKLENKKDIPQQMNGSDCGMFACKFAEYLSRRARINFDQEHMPYFRRRMVYEIITANLL